MTTNLERIEYELKLAGYKLEPIDENDPSDEKYVQRIGNCVYEICKLFAEQGHSGLSASITLQLLDELLVKGNTLSSLTNNPDEWMDVTEMSGYKLHQSKRKFSCFSDDNLNTYYDTNDENRELIPLLEWNNTERL
jgi:hypothetical protein